MTKLSQNIAALSAACALALTIMVPVVTVPADAATASAAHHGAAIAHELA